MVVAVVILVSVGGRSTGGCVCVCIDNGSVKLEVNNRLLKG